VAVRILWDAAKSAANRRKHGISFEEVRPLFAPAADRLEIHDEVHSLREDRFLAIGPVGKRLVVVVFTEPRDNVLRIVSARRATPAETRMFQRHMEEAWR